MVLSIIEYIGKNLLSENPYIDTFGANCITTKDGRVVNFIGKDKEDFGPSDIRGIGSYARIEPTIEYTDIQSKTSSCKQSTKGSIKFRLVVFQVNAVNNILNPAKLENKIWADLQKINFNSYAGNESQISLVVNSSDLDFYSNFTKEVGKKYEVGADAVIIALNCTLTWSASADNCEICSITGSSSLCIDGVTIKDELGQVVAIVECGGDYILPSLVPQSRVLTINGVPYDLSQDRSWNIGTGGGETLSQTLALGNTTGGNNLIVDDNDSIFVGSNQTRYITYSPFSANPGLILGNINSGEYVTLLDAGGLNFNGTAISMAELGTLSGVTSSVQTQLNSKEPSIVAGTTAQYWRGDKSWQTLNTSAVPEASNLYYTVARFNTAFATKSTTDLTEGSNLYYTQARFDTAFGLKSTTNLSEGTNLYFTTARVLATTLAGLSITGSTIASSDSIISAFGKLQNQINGVLGGAIYQGVWNANTNSPTLSSGSGTKGYYYVVSVAGSTNLDGTTDWKVGDWAIFNGTTWDKVDNTDAVASVNGAIGAVVITVTGTSNRISVTGGTGLTPTIDISTSYVGQTSITTLGTIGTGVWQGTQIGDAYLAVSYIKADGSRALTADWNAGAFNITSKTQSISGTGGAGYMELIAQSSNVSASASSSFRLFAGSTGSFNWVRKNGTDTYVRTFDATLSADRTYTLQDASSTIAMYSNNLSVFASTTSAQFRGILSDPNGTGAVSFTDSPVFTTKITSPQVLGSSAVGGTLLIDATSDNTKGAITFGTSTRSNSYIFNVGSSTSQVIIREAVGSTSSAIYIGVASGSESSTNFAFSWNGALRVNAQTATSNMQFQCGTSTMLQITPGNSVGSPFFDFSVRARTTLTASTNIPVLNVNGQTQSWAAGTLATQYFYYFKTNTLAFASASTATFVTGVTFEMPTRGTNATFGTAAGIYVPTLAYTSTTLATAAYFEAPTGATSNYAAYLSGSLILATAGNGILIKEGTNATMGVATLVAGTVTVSTTKVTANSRIFLEVQSLGTVAVATPVAITARTAGTSFTISSSSITDTSVIAWMIVEPG